MDEEQQRSENQPGRIQRLGQWLKKSALELELWRRVAVVVRTVATVAVAGATIVIAWQANQLIVQQNKLVEQQNQMMRQDALPILTAQTVHLDQPTADGYQDQMIVISNVGGPAQGVRVSPYAYFRFLYTEQSRAVYQIIPVASVFDKKTQIDSGVGEIYRLGMSTEAPNLTKTNQTYVRDFDDLVRQWRNQDEGKSVEYLDIAIYLHVSYEDQFDEHHEVYFIRNADSTFSKRAPAPDLTDGENHYGVSANRTGNLVFGQVSSDQLFQIWTSTFGVKHFDSSPPTDPAPSGGAAPGAAPLPANE